MSARPSISEIRRLVARTYGLKSDARLPAAWTATRPRRVAIYLSVELTGRSLSRIARAFGVDAPEVRATCIALGRELRDVRPLAKEVAALRRRLAPRMAGGVR